MTSKEILDLRVGKTSKSYIKKDSLGNKVSAKYVWEFSTKNKQYSEAINLLRKDKTLLTCESYSNGSANPIIIATTNFNTKE